MTIDITTAPIAPLTRPRTLLVGTLLAIGATFMYFAALFGIYFSERAAAASWFPEGAISLVPGGMMMVTLAMSCITVQWAVYAITHNYRLHSYVALGLSAIFGLSVINQTVFYYTDMGLGLADSKAAFLMYLVTGSHLVMVGAAVVFVLLMAIRALVGDYSGHRSDGIVAAAMFWYAMVAVYFVIWYGIYIAK